MFCAWDKEEGLKEHEGLTLICHSLTAGLGHWASAGPEVSVT